MGDGSLALRTAFERGGAVAATTTLLRGVGERWSRPDPRRSLDLLGLLRSNEVSPPVRGRQDILVADDDVDPTGVIEELARRPAPIQIIAYENQWLWQAQLVVDGVERPRARIINEETGDHFLDLDLGDFLLLMTVASVLAPRFADPHPLVGRRVDGLDPDRLVGPDLAEAPHLRLPRIALGDGWLVASWADPTAGTLVVPAGTGVEERQERARVELGARW